MVAWIGASASQRYFQYTKPAAVAALRRGDHDAVRDAILAEVEAMGERPAEEGLEQRRYDRRLKGHREQYAANERQRRRDLWLAGGPMPKEVREEFEAAGQPIPAYLAR